MGKVITKKIQGMSWVFKTSLVLLLTLATSVFMYEGWYKPKQAAAAPINATAWAQQYASATYPAGQINATYSVPAGSNRLLVVAIASTQTATGTAQTVSNVTWNGQPLTLAAGDGATTTQWNHTYLYYLKDASMPVSTTAAPLNVTVSGGTSYYTTVAAAVYTGVDQTANPFTQAVSRNGNGGAGGTSAGPTNLNIAAGDQAILIASAARVAAGTTARTLTFDATNPAGWLATPGATLATAIITNGPCFQYYVKDRSVTTALASDISTHTISNTGWWSIAAMSLKAYVPPSDSTPPTAGTVTVSPDISSTYTSSSPTITTVFTDAESAVTSCQYTTDGSAWVAGSVSGAGPYTCTATPTGRSGFLNINMRATSAGGTGTATQIQRTVDTAPPTDGALTVVRGDGSNSLSWTAAYDAGFGVSSYSLVFATGAIPPATCAAGTPVTGSPFSPSTLSTVHSSLTNGTVYSYRLCATDNNNLTSAGVTGSGTPLSDPTKVTSCTACHFKSGIADGTNRNEPLGYFQGSHGPHAAGTNNYACSVCHTVPGPTEYDHTNRSIAMQTSINGGSYNKTSPFAPSNIFAPSTCNNTTCHGTQSPQWGTVVSGTTCNKCHSDTTITTTFRTTAQTTNTPKSLIHISHLNGTHGISGATAISCADCHTIPATANASGHNDTPLPAEVPMNGAAASKNAARNFDAPSETCANVYCHGTGTPTWKTTFLNFTIADCDKCHALPPTPGSGSHSTIPAAITSIAGLSACSSRAPSTGCHPTINAAPLTYAGIFFDKTLHIDGTVQGGSCVGCHSITQPQATPKRIAAANQFNFQSHHVQGATADGTHCAKCHWEANSDGSINSTYHDQVGGKPVDLVIWTGTSRPAGTTYT